MPPEQVQAMAIYNTHKKFGEVWLHGFQVIWADRITETETNILIIILCIRTLKDRVNTEKIKPTMTDQRHRQVGCWRGDESCRWWCARGDTVSPSCWPATADSAAERWCARCCCTWPACHARSSELSSCTRSASRSNTWMRPSNTTRQQHTQVTEPSEK